MTSRPSAHYLPAELLTLVGQIAIQSAYLDLLVGDLLGGLTGIDKDERSASIHILDTRRKIQDAEKAVKTRVREPDRSQLLSILKQAGDYLADRNLTQHAVIVHRPDDHSLKDPIYVAFRGKHKGAEKPFAHETLLPILTEAERLCSELCAACDAYGFFLPPPSTEKP
jgi:hypothetical protein